MSTEFSPADGGIRQRDDFGNFEANLRFLGACNVLHPELAVLEIGTGKGRLLQWLRARGIRACGVELNAAMIAEGQRLHGPLPVTRMAAEALGFPDATFDVVLSFDVLEHIPDTDRHLAEVRRVLKPRGSYLLQTPNAWINPIFETIRYRSLTAWRADHCSLHSAAQLRRRLAKHAFVVTFHDVPVVNEWFRRKVRAILGLPGALVLTVLNPDRWPRPLRTNFYVQATLGDAHHAQARTFPHAAAPLGD